MTAPDPVVIQVAGLLAELSADPRGARARLIADGISDFRSGCPCPVARWLWQKTGLAWKVSYYMAWLDDFDNQIPIRMTRIPFAVRRFMQVHDHRETA